MPGARKDTAPVSVEQPGYVARTGHLPRCTSGTELITFSPTAEIVELNGVIAKNLALLVRASAEGGA
jgi:hypothetical protein